jgi:hypothetical protein
VRSDGTIACGSEDGAVHLYGPTTATSHPQQICPQGCVSAVAWGVALGPHTVPLLAAGCSDGSVYVEAVL